jgi:hypothetical protein
MNSPKPQAVFDAITYAGVMQDKATPQRTYKASGEPSYSSPPAQLRPKHHGSQKRQLCQVSGCITNDAFQRLEVMRNAGKKNEVSRSSVVGKFVTQGIQQNADMQYISMLEPIIKKVIERKIDSYANRIAFLTAQDYYASKTVEIFLGKIVKLLPSIDIDLCNRYLKQSRKEAVDSLNKKMEG